MTAAATATTEAPLRRDPDFRRYFLARALSALGTLTTLIALPVLVYRISGSAAITALVTALEAAPYLIFGLLAGALTDRWDRRRVMVVADVLNAAVIASVPVAHLLGVLTLGHVLVVAFVGPAIFVFFDGAVFGAVPALVGRHRIGQANSYVWTVQSICDVLAPSVAGVALAVLHPAMMLAFDAATFLVSAVLIRGIRKPLQEHGRERATLTARQVGQDIGEGLRYLWRHGGVRTMTLVSLSQSLAAGGFVALMVVWADRQLGVGTQGLRFGVVFGAWAVGSILASLVLPRLLRRTTPARITLLAIPASATLGVITPVWHRWWLGALFLVVWSIFYTLVAINGVTYRQQATPDHLLGRVNTAGRMLAWGVGWTGGAVVAGALAPWLGLGGTLFTVTSLAFAGVVVAWTSPLVRDGRSDVA
jgi:hypothetical protein